jgi:hypothetical protein
MKTRIFQTLSVVGALTLIATLIVFALPAQSEAAPSGTNDHGGLTTPVTVVSSRPGLTIAAFQGSGLTAAGTPAGTFEGVAITPADGKGLTMFVPVGMMTSLYTWDSAGYKLIGTVSPVNSNDKATLSAN